MSSDIEQWLESLGLGQHVETSAENAIDPEIPPLPMIATLRSSVPRWGGEKGFFANERIWAPRTHREEMP